MALLYESMHRAMDDSGVPMPFAELYTRDPVATTTPKATYSDPDLDVSHLNTNPLVADAAGYFGPIYAGSDEQFYLILTVADGDPTAPYKVYADVTAIGGDAGTSFDRTFTSARLKITSGDVDTGVNGILIQTGPSSPDDTGGAVRMQGQAGTQGDLAILDYSVTELTGTVDVSGNATIGGSALVDDDLTITNPTKAGSVYAKLGSGTATAQTAVDIPLDADFDSYILEIENLSSAASPDIRCVLSFDAVPNFKTAAGDYTGVPIYIGGTTTGATSNSANMVLFPSGISSGAVLYGRITLRLNSRAGEETAVVGIVHLVKPSNVTLWPQGATNAKSYGKATFIRILTASSTISFRWTLFGVPGA